jgi:hypothetical protein
MYYLAHDERSLWQTLEGRALAGTLTPADRLDDLRCALRPSFHFQMGGLLNAGGQEARALDWFRAGSLEEGGMFNAVMAAFLDRHGGRLRMPEAPIFADPRPYEHFTTVPTVMGMRSRFLDFAASTLPRFAAPLTIVDVGCGDGSLLVLLLNRLLEAGRVDRIGRVVLVDSSAAMLDLAGRKIAEAFPGVPVDRRLGRIQEHAGTLPEGMDIALLSLAYHHMPRDEKAVHLRELAAGSTTSSSWRWTGTTTPPISIPPNWLFPSISPTVHHRRHLCPRCPHRREPGCVDNFIMAEVISLITQPRGYATITTCSGCSGRGSSRKTSPATPAAGRLPS